MATIQCDLHLHSALSPCADNEMTPGNIVSMAYMNGLDVIAITDHCSTKNCEAAIELAKTVKQEYGRAPLVIPGMELEVAEGFHVVALFPDLKAASEFDDYLTKNRPVIPNRVDIFGEQWVYNNNDEPVVQIPNLLSTSSFLSMSQVQDALQSIGAAFFPAHVDKDAYSMVASLGTVPPEWVGRLLELSKRADKNAFLQAHPELSDYYFIVDSDAHQLPDIADPGFSLPINDEMLPNLDIPSFVNALRDFMR